MLPVLFLLIIKLALTTCCLILAAINDDLLDEGYFMWLWPEYNNSIYWGENSNLYWEKAYYDWTKALDGKVVAEKDVNWIKGWDGGADNLIRIFKKGEPLKKGGSGKGPPGDNSGLGYGSEDNNNRRKRRWVSMVPDNPMQIEFMLNENTATQRQNIVNENFFYERQNRVADNSMQMPNDNSNNNSIQIQNISNQNTNNDNNNNNNNPMQIQNILNQNNNNDNNNNNNPMQIQNILNQNTNRIGNPMRIQNLQNDNASNQPQNLETGNTNSQIQNENSNKRQRQYLGNEGSNKRKKPIIERDESEPSRKANRRRNLIGPKYRYYEFISNRGRYIYPEAYHSNGPICMGNNTTRVYNDQGGIRYTYMCESALEEDRYCQITYPDGTRATIFNKKTVMQHIDYQKAKIKEGYSLNPPISYVDNYKEQFDAARKAKVNARK